MTCRFKAALFLGCFGAAMYAFGGDLDEWNPLAGNRRGINLYEVSTDMMYFSAAGAGQSSPYVNIPSDTMTRVGAVIGWSHQGAWPFSVTYIPAYTTSVENSAFDRLHHGLTLTGGRHRINDRWSLTLTGNASLQDMASFSFMGPSLGGFSNGSEGTSALVSSTGISSSGNFPFLLAGLPQQTTGSSTSAVGSLQDPSLKTGLTDSQIASLLTGAPASNPINLEALYGTQVFVSSLTAQMNYRPVRELSIEFAVGGSRTQYMDSPGQTQSYRPFERTTAANASFGTSYLLTRNTTIGVSAQTSRQFSSLQDGYRSSGAVFLEQKFRRWYVRGGVGASQAQTSRSTYAVPSGIQMYWNGSGGFRTRAHTVSVSGSESAGDPYAIGGESTLTVSASWSWARPHTKWMVMADGAQERIKSQIYKAIDLWRVTGGAGYRLGDHMTFRAQYFWLKYDGGSGPLPYVIAYDGVSATLSWRPHSAERQTQPAGGK